MTLTSDCIYRARKASMPFWQPLFPFITEKTTTPSGYRAYMRAYMHALKELKKKEKQA